MEIGTAQHTAWHGMARHSTAAIEPENKSCTSSQTCLEVQGYSFGCTAAWILFLEAIIELRQLLPLAVCQRTIPVRLQLHGGSQAVMVPVIVRRELEHVPAEHRFKSRSVNMPWPLLWVLLQSVLLRTVLTLPCCAAYNAS